MDPSRPRTSGSQPNTGPFVPLYSSRDPTDPTESSNDGGVSLTTSSTYSGGVVSHPKGFDAPHLNEHNHACLRHPSNIDSMYTTEIYDVYRNDPIPDHGTPVFPTVNSLAHPLISGGAPIEGTPFGALEPPHELVNRPVEYLKFSEGDDDDPTTRYGGGALCPTHSPQNVDIPMTNTRRRVSIYSKARDIFNGLRAESEQRRRDEERVGFAELREALPSFSKRASKAVVLRRAVSHIKGIEKCLREARRELRQFHTGNIHVSDIPYQHQVSVTGFTQAGTSSSTIEEFSQDAITH